MSRLLPPPPLPGDRVGPYILRELLGVGGNATVYRGTSDEGVEAAIKILHPGKLDTDERRRFTREFLALRQLRHPNIVAVYDCGEREDYPWIAMEYVGGIDLDSQLQRWREDPDQDRFQRVEPILRGLCAALAYLHEQGMIHRDLKPSNVLLTPGGEPKLSDFGVVKAPGSFDTQLTHVGRLVGTVAYMAPEQIMGDPVDSRADLYSLGAVLYTLLTLRKPIEADTIPGYLARHLTHTPAPPSEIDPRVPPHLERICAQLLLKDPAQRFASARQILEILEHGLPATRPPVHGRDALLSALLLRFAELDRGAGGVVVLAGAPGSGKTTLLQALQERAQAAGHDLAACRGGDPFPFATLAEAVPGARPGEPLAALAERLRGKPWTLLIDDVDALPDADLAELTALVRERIAVEGEPLLVFAATAAEEGRVAPLVTGAATGLTPERVAIEGLARPAVLALVRGQGVGGAAGAALGQRLFEDLSGHPGAIIAQIQALVRAGWLAADETGELRCTRSIEDLREAALPLPDVVRSREVARLEHLSPLARRVLDALVVLDMEGTSSLLARVLSLEEHALSGAVVELLAEGLLARRREGVQEVLALSPNEPRNLLYSLIDPAYRATLHREIAQALQERSRRAGPQAEVIARHLLQGGEVGAAWPLLLSGAQRRLRSGDLAEARRLLRLAQDAQPAAEARLDPAECAQHRRLLFSLEADLREKQGDLTGAISAWERALDAAQEEGNPDHLARIRSGLGLARCARGEAALAMAGLEEAIGILPQGDPMWPKVAQALAAARLEGGDVEGAARLWRQLVALGDAIRDETARAEAAAGLGAVALVRGSIEEGRQQLEDALRRLEAAPHDLAQLRRLLLLAELEIAAGRTAQAAAAAGAAEQVAREIPRLSLCLQAVGLAATALATAGELAEARQRLQAAAPLLSSLGASADDLRARLAMARAWMLLGEGAQARALLADPDPGSRVGLDDPGGRWLAQAARLSSEPARARAWVLEALDRPAAALPWAAARIELDAAAVLGGQGERAAARALLYRAAARCGSLPRLAAEAAALAGELGLGGPPTPLA